jgi:hypothetical protein
MLSPALSDREVRGAVRTAHAYDHARAALLALSGIALLQQLGRGDPGALVGVAVTAGDQLEQARAECVATATPADIDVRRRNDTVAAAVDVLADLVAEFRRDPIRPVRVEALDAVRRTLARVSAPEVGVRWLSSVSCAGRLSDPTDVGHGRFHGSGDSYGTGPGHAHHH